jgi:hypothetical protein
MLWLRTCLLVLAVSRAAWAQDSFFPFAVAPGTTTEIVLTGSNLIQDAWTSFPASVSNGTGRIHVSVPTGAPVGIGAFRVATSNGLSPLHLIMIDDLPSIRENGSNNTISAAQAITPPIAIDGACNELGFDFYRFPARKGQTLAIEAVAQRLGSEADTVLRVLSDKGDELLFADDAAAGRDSRCTFKIPKTGDYLLELRDMNYAGGNAYRYRLRIGDFPLVTAVYPPAIRRGDKATIQWLGTNLKPVEASPGPVSVRPKRHSGFATVLPSDLAETLESEPNDQEPNPITLPGAVSGRFERDGDRDLFRFEAEKDQRMVFAAATRSLSSPCDVSIRIIKPDGSQVAEGNVDDATITNTFKQSGPYLLEVRELTGKGAADFVYRIELQPLEPGFVLSAETNTFEHKDGALTLKVTCARRDYSAEVTLALAENADWFTLKDHVIESKKNETVLKLKPTESCPKRKILILELQGRGKGLTVPVCRKAPLTELERLLFAYVP